jgi:hypothetical protein
LSRLLCQGTACPRFPGGRIPTAGGSAERLWKPVSHPRSGGLPALDGSRFPRLTRVASSNPPLPACICGAPSARKRRRANDLCPQVNAPKYDLSKPSRKRAMRMIESTAKATWERIAIVIRRISTMGESPLNGRPGSRGAGGTERPTRPSKPLANSILDHCMDAAAISDFQRVPRSHPAAGVPGLHAHHRT